MADLDFDDLPPVDDYIDKPKEKEENFDDLPEPAFDDLPEPVAEKKEGYGLKDFGKDVAQAVPFIPDDMDFAGRANALGSSVTDVPVIRPAIRKAARKVGPSIEALYDKLIHGKKYDEALAERQKAFDAERGAADKEATEDRSKHKDAALIGNFVQGIATPGMALKGTTLAGKTAAGATNTGVTAYAAYQDVLLRGGSKEDAMKAAKSVGMFAGGMNAIPAASHAAGKTADALKGFANRRAVKSLEPILSQQEVLANKGLADKLGAEILDSKVVKFGSSVDDMAPRMEDVIRKKGEEIGSIRSGVDDLINKQPAERVNLDYLTRKGDLQESMLSASDLSTQRMAKAYSKNAANLNNKPLRNLEQMQQDISLLNNQIPFNKPYAEMTSQQQALYDLRKDMVGLMDGKVQHLAPEKMSRYDDLKQGFSLLKEGDKILDKSVARSARNNDFGLSSLLSANTAKKEGSGSIVRAVLHKLASERGNSAMAVTANKVANIIGTDPQKLGPFAAILNSAAQRGPAAVLAAHKILLQKEPKYQEIIDGLPDEESK